MAVRRKPLSASTKATLRRKAKASKRYTYGTLAKVYRRGQGAFLSAGSRPRMSMNQWAMARVNAFITKGKAYYTADADLAKKARAAKKGKK